MLIAEREANDETHHTIDRGGLSKVGSSRDFAAQGEGVQAFRYRQAEY
jgi:hypothetical protein